MNEPAFRFKGNFMAISDQRFAYACVEQGFKVIILEDPVENNSIKKVVRGTAYLPRVEMFQALVNGDTEIFRNMYNEYLNSDEMVYQLTCTIICALYQGQSVAIYCPQNVLEIGFVEYLLDFFRYNLGLYIQVDPQHPFVYDSGKLPMLLSILYKYEFITKEEFIMYLPYEFFNNKEIFKMLGVNQFEEQQLKEWKKAMVNQNKPLRCMLSFN